MKKIGILGGSFDPIHLGHIQLALQAKEELNLDKVLFIPAKRQPFKLNRKVTSEEHRVRMLEFALQGIEGLEISYIELENDEISYTINTLRRIKDFYRNREIFFILGTDAFINIELWHEAAQLLQECSFAIGSRPGYKEEELKSCIDRIRQVYNTNIVLLNNKELLISSSDIKTKIGRGVSIKALVPDAVERYIDENGLYK
ncbi:MAG: nicotinate-nucleotide adenylyltransferase [Clostridiales bacterium]|jgi:nicotinate-nucleotide adenylyltransferase|uniref:nicotinate-nucleotide adenylyltransferase n=1 Tax=Aminipila sp. TaxID=2060095 RepID=UPI001E075CCE|nr:nicotinate-nucleotide adenylyltransferase [Aminipila sp.]MBE6033841.1 nicotinate-nucleotide adenylyltransferase [Clostridiales bacterium]